jgi:type I restriction enzyme S subunit
MSELPTRSILSSWAICKIQDIAMTATGGTPSRSVDAYFGGPIPWVKSGELGDSHVYATEETLTEIGLDSSNAKIFPKGTLCVALYGATVGKLGILEIDAATNQAVCGVFLGNGVLRDYVFHYLASIRRHLIEQGKGGAQSNISNGLIRETHIPIAPTNEQRRIVAKIEELFSDLDAGVAALQRVKAKLKRYRAAVLKAAVEGKLTEEWRKKNRPKETGQQLLDRILVEHRRKWEEEQLETYERAGTTLPAKWKDRYAVPAGPDTSTLPELPTGWCWASVRQVGKVQLGRQRAPQHHSGPHMRPYLRVANVFEDRIDIADVMEMNFTPAEYETYRLHHGDILLNEGQSMELVGRPAIYRDEVPGACFTNTLVRFQSSRDLHNDYAIAVFLTYLKNGRFQKIATITVNIAHLGAGRFAGMEFPLPPLEEQLEIVLEVNRRLSLLKAIESLINANLKRSARLRQSILKRAFEGKLVPQDPNDEPARVLLERIKAENSAAQNNGEQRRPRETKGIAR